MSQELPVIIVVVPLIVSFVISFTGWWYKRLPFILSLAALSVCLAGSILIFHTILSQGTIQYQIG